MMKYFEEGRRYRRRDKFTNTNKIFCECVWFYAAFIKFFLFSRRFVHEHTYIGVLKDSRSFTYVKNISRVIVCVCCFVNSINIQMSDKNPLRDYVCMVFCNITTHHICTRRTILFYLCL